MLLHYFEGVCPNDCSNHGACVTMNEMALLKGPDYNHATNNSGDGIGVDYSNWDKGSVTLCNCDLGRFGPDCSLSKLSCCFYLTCFRKIMFIIPVP